MTGTRKGHETVVYWPSTCDFCQATATYDGATRQGPWAFMCDEHFAIHGRGTGSGVGQRLVRKSDPIRIREGGKS